ncbi:MAG: hypothetical protein AB8H79_21450 [Myxococcota bacterium]
MDNPFSAPEAGPGGVLGTSGTDNSWIEGKNLVVPKDAVLPLVCAKCGSEEDVQHVRLKMAWVPMWVRLTILLSPLVMLILWFIFQKKADLQVGLCETHRTRRNLSRVIGGVITVGGILAGMVGCFMIDIIEEVALIGIFAGLMGVVVGVVVLAVGAVVLRVTKVTDTHAYVAGANETLMDAATR